MNYTTYINQICGLVVIASSDPVFVNMEPGMIDYAEQRLYRELDPLYAQFTDVTTVSSGDRNMTPPTTLGTYITIDSVNIITPAGSLSSAGTRNPLTPISPEAMDALYPSGQTITDVPAYYAMRSPTVVLLGPAPDAAYQAEIIGVQRPATLSVSNSSTFLTQYCPDLFVAASMVYAMGFQRDYGAQTDNPQASGSWEAQYQTLFKSAGMEQARAKWQADGWTSQVPAPAGKRP